MTNNLPKLELPNSLNYIGAFLTMGCNLKCSYCINIPDTAQDSKKRDDLFPIQTMRSHNGLTPDQWIEAFNRIPNSDDLPITLQGGEPTIYYGGRGVGQIFEGVEHYFDLLTNMASISFYKTLNGQEHKLQRNAPYPSIRVSWHQEEMDRVWKGKGFEELVRRCERLKHLGFSVSPDKSESDVGIYMVGHPSNELPDETLWKDKVPFEVKEFLGTHEGQLYGTYKYPNSTNIVGPTLECECRTSELLIDPYGFVWGCHYHLYDANANNKIELNKLFETSEVYSFRYKRMLRFGSVAGYGDALKVKPIGHILDPEFSMDDLTIFRKCYDYGRCIGCDVKVKNDSKQSLDDRGVAHTSVEIINIRHEA